ncbi:MAG: hypothetical protein KatS3mg118_3091 [Paracoccaceae bacterium]|nr:MAG: hypothetical protein KatS3mg118_3091 [Paracoccaceae bacterium]
MDWLNALVQGVLLGGLYALFAAGLSLIFGVMRLVNIAHGDLIVLSAYLALSTTLALAVHPLAALAIVLPAMAAIGYCLQRGLLEPHPGRRHPAAAAGHLRPVGDHPERASGESTPPIRRRWMAARSRPRASPSGR